MLERMSIPSHRNHLGPRAQGRSEQRVHIFVRHPDFDPLAHPLDPTSITLLKTDAEIRRKAGQNDIAVHIVTAKKIRDGALVTDMTFHDDGHAITDHLHVRQDVGIHEHRPSIRTKLQDDIPDLLASDRVKSTHGFVKKDDTRVMNQRLSDPYTLQHPLGKSLQPGIRCVLKTDIAQECGNLRLAVGRTDPGQPGIEIKNLTGSEKGIEIRVLRKESHFLSKAALRNRMAENRRLSRGRTDQTHQDLERRRLPGSIGSNKAIDLPFSNRKRHLIQDSARSQPKSRTKVLDQSFHLDSFVCQLSHCPLLASPFHDAPSSEEDSDTVPADRFHSSIR